ncbi:hypothetical protein Tsubulata_006835 [Turnera subulata]|uniref:Dehydrin n=1 Tax=Turnera subulata TaxID=218843 RepID=A0A9Q0J3Y1_9ROSI|nr:hypothetical protein Tsubulata_006835 [Turnera subulata]
MAELKDECGNPIQLTDELGRPVQLTDEHGNPVKIKGIAIKESAETFETATKEEIEAPKKVVETMEEVVEEPKVVETAKEDTKVADTGLLASTGAPGLGSTTEGKHETEAVEHGVEAGGYEAGELRKEEPDQETSGEINQGTSSSSSSSEDDGQGGRRKKKKGLAQKLKEKLHVGGKHKEEHEHKVSVSTTTTTSTGSVPPAEHEKKSVLEKIKEKLPGHHNHST